MAIQKTAKLIFKDEKHNHTLEVDPLASDEAIKAKYQFVNKEVPNAPYEHYEMCIDVEVTTKEITPMNQAEFEGFFNAYCEDLKNKGVHAFCSDVRALSTWVRRDLKIDSCSWDFTSEKINDMYGTPLTVGTIEDQRFVLFSMEQTKLFNKIGQKVRGLNNGEYGRSRPDKVKGNSFYNSSNQLIFWYGKEQKERLEAKMQDQIDWNNAWDEYKKVKDQRNSKTYVPVNDIIAMHFMESVPPVRFGLTRFLAGEACEHNAQGQKVFQEFRRVNKTMWETKYTTAQEFDKQK